MTAPNDAYFFVKLPKRILSNVLLYNYKNLESDLENHPQNYVLKISL